jgi:hypothetical protein
MLPEETHVYHHHSEKEKPTPRVSFLGCDYIRTQTRTKKKKGNIMLNMIEYADGPRLMYGDDKIADWYRALTPVQQSIARHEREEAFMNKHELAFTKARSCIWKVLKGKGHRCSIKCDTVKRILHFDHYKIFRHVPSGTYFFTNQPYDLNQQEFDQWQAFCEEFGGETWIEPHELAFWFPGRTPLVVVSKVRKG